MDWPGHPSFLYGWVTMWLEFNRRHLPADQCNHLSTQMDRFIEAHRERGVYTDTNEGGAK